MERAETKSWSFYDYVPTAGRTEHFAILSVRENDTAKKIYCFKYVFSFVLRNEKGHHVFRVAWVSVSDKSCGLDRL